MGRHRHGAQHLGPYYRFAVAVLEPFLTLWTRRERRNLEILERDYPPNDGIIVVVNHMSWFDPMNVSHVLWDAGRPPRFLAKDRLFDVPGLGQVLDGAGQIPVFRETADAASAVRAAIEAVNAGECVVIYPEGTMTRDPDLWPMTGRTGAAQLALITGAPVIPMAQWGPQEVMAPYAKEFKLFPPKKMQTMIGEPVDFSDLIDQDITKEVLEEATARIISDITRLLEELRGESAPPERLDFRDWKAQNDGVEAEAAAAAGSVEESGDHAVASSPSPKAAPPRKRRSVRKVPDAVPGPRSAPSPAKKASRSPKPDKGGTGTVAQSSSVASKTGPVRKKSTASKATKSRPSTGTRAKSSTTSASSSARTPKGKKGVRVSASS